MFIETHLALGPAALLGRPVPELWQLVTSLFVHLEPWSFFFNMLGLWFVGATIERQLGRTPLPAAVPGARRCWATWSWPG